jgi:hypothetical protein
MPKASRQEVTLAVHDERDYQEKLKAAAHGGPNAHEHEIPAYIVYMEHYIAKAKAITSTDWSPQSNERALHELRKVTALGFACMEAHGAPTRGEVSNEHVAKRVS